jgi:hypothetical protein
MARADARANTTAGRLAPVDRSSLPGPLRYQVLTGSHAYGLAGPGSDMDWRGIYQVPTESLFGLATPPAVMRLPGDQTYWEMLHFVKMCLEGNPNVLETLWVEPDMVAVSSPLAEALRRIRRTFFSDLMVSKYLSWAADERRQLLRERSSPAATPKLLAGKAGSHLVRLLIELRGALRDGELRVRLVGADLVEVSAIRAGQVSAERVLARVGELESECRSFAAIRRWPPPDPKPAEAILLRARRGEL